MLQLQRVTTEYIDVEDRMKMTGELNADRTMVLWLNQRLLLRLLPHLFLWLEKQIGEGIPIEIQQSFAQEAAAVDIDHEQSPVTSLHDSQSWLVSSIDITPDTNSFLLCFKGSGAQEVTLPFTAQQLRQWLSILSTLWDAAEWPLTAWPRWLRHSTQDYTTETSARSYH